MVNDGGFDVRLLDSISIGHPVFGRHVKAYKHDDVDLQLARNRVDIADDTLQRNVLRQMERSTQIYDDVVDSWNDVRQGFSDRFGERAVDFGRERELTLKQILRHPGMTPVLAAEAVQNADRTGTWAWNHSWKFRENVAEHNDLSWRMYKHKHNIDEPVLVRAKNGEIAIE